MLSFWHLPSFVERSDKSAVVADLSRINGHYFALVIPSGWKAADFVVKVAGHLVGLDDPIKVLVGQDQRQVPLHSPLRALHGDVVTVARNDFDAGTPANIGHLFVPEAIWDPLPQVLASSLSPAWAVWFRDEIFALAPEQITETAVLGRLAAICRIAVRDLRVTSFLSLHDLEVAGRPCFGLLVPLIPDEVEVELQARGTVLVIDARRVGAGVRVQFCARRTSSMQQLGEAAGIPSDACALLCWEEVARSDEGPWHCCLIRLQDGRRCPHSDLSPVSETDAVTGHPARFYTCSLLHDPRQSAVADTGEEEAESEESLQDSDDDPSSDEADEVQAHFVVLSPNRVAQQVQVALPNPCTVQVALNAVEQGVDDDFYRLFPLMIAAPQQVSRHWGLVVAIPAWAGEEMLGILDARQLDGRLFVAAIPPLMSKNRALAAAGLDEDTEVSVYLYDSEAPLGDEDEVPSIALGTIRFLPVADPVPALRSLAANLHELSNWAEEVELSFSVPWQQAGEVCAVLDYGCRAFTLMPGRAHCHNLDISTVFNIPLCWTTVQTTRPPIRDFALVGRTCKGVALVSAQIANVPLPPRRPGPCQYLIAVDCRPILCAIDQWLVTDHICPHAELAEHYDTFAPADHQVQIEGTEIRDGNLVVTPGLVLTVQFVPCTPASCNVDCAETDHGLASRTDELLRSTGSGGDAAEPGPAQDSARRDNASHSAVERSRSPRRFGCSGLSNQDRETVEFQHMASVAVVAHMLIWLPVWVLGQVACWAARLQAEVAVWSCLRCLGGFASVGARRPISKQVVMCLPRSTASAIDVGSEDDTPGETCHTDCHSVFLDHGRQAGSDIWSGEPVPVSCRLLTEPSCCSTAETQQLDHLRFVTVEFGDAWPYFHDGIEPNHPHLADAGTDSEEEDAPRMPRWIRAVVLKPLYAPEEYRIAITFPATPDEVAGVLQNVRPAQVIATFPHLIAVAPQPLDGVGTHIATPIWQGNVIIACLDTQAVDGRVFACCMPEYVSRAQILRFADLPWVAAVWVFVGFDETPIGDEAQVHLFPAITIRVVPADAPAPVPLCIAQLLLSELSWRYETDFTWTVQDGVYCLVLRFGFRIFFADVARPLQYRDRLAASVGIPTSELALFPAGPKVEDAEIDGYLCRTVIVAVPRGFVGEEGFCFIVDGRPILQGWLCFRATQHRIVAGEVLRVLNQEAPLGWKVTVGHAGSDQDILHVHPGAVLQACYYPEENGPGLQHEDWTRQEAVDLFDWLWDAQVADTDPDSPRADESLLPEVSESIPSADFLGSFLVLACDFAVECYQVPLRAPATVWQVVSAVRRLRFGVPASRLSALVESFPQPDTSFGVLVACPAWPHAEAVVAVDGRQADGRIFAIVVSRRMNTESLLVAAGYDPSGQFLAYFRDEPQHLERGEVRDISSGDLVVVVPRMHQLFVSAALPDMLLSAVGWRLQGQPPFAQHERTLVLTDAGEMQVEVDYGDLADIRQQLAQEVGVDETELLVIDTHTRSSCSMRSGVHHLVQC